MKIAGKRTTADWKKLKKRLKAKPTGRLWRSAYQNFFYTRIQTRYLDPIASIKEHDRYLGEGFSIVALFCTLVEYLESCEKGHTYRYFKKNDPPLGPFEYSQNQASSYFRAFLLTREPFKTQVPIDLIDSFYRHVRCGLLHEARTKNGWLISTRPSGGRLLVRKGKKVVLFRQELLDSLDAYLEDYKRRLLIDPDTQDALIRKFDQLCID